MAGPFPGMKPYLEDEFLWQGFRNGFVAEIGKALNVVLPAGYWAVIEQRLATFPEDQLLPAGPPLIRRSKPAIGNSHFDATRRERGEPDGMVGVTCEDVYDWYIRIDAGRRPDSRVVTVIDLLSPGNKAAGSHGRRDYQQLQRERLHSDFNLMEIDLLRHGSHTVLAPLELLPPRHQWEYIVCLHRVRERFQYEYWLNRRSQPLPEVRIPLLAGEPDAFLDCKRCINGPMPAGGLKTKWITRRPCRAMLGDHESEFCNSSQVWISGVFSMSRQKASPGVQRHKILDAAGRLFRSLIVRSVILFVAAIFTGAAEQPVFGQTVRRHADDPSQGAAAARIRRQRKTDDYEIYALLLAKQLHVAGKRFVLQSDTRQYHAQLELIDPKLDARYAHSPDLVAALHDYNSSNRQSVSLRSIHGAKHAIYASQAELNRVFKHGFWRAFYAKYTGATGLARLARPGYSLDGSTAIGYCSFSRAGLAGFGQLIWMKNQNGKWVVVKTISGWVS